MGKDIRKLGGGPLLNNNKSIFELVSKYVPEYPWIPWKFRRIPPNFWNDLSNQRKFLESIAKDLNVNKIEDWYNVTVKV